MENNSNSAEDLKTIRKIMEESTRFLSISGLSGIFIGLTAIAGAVVAYLTITFSWDINYYEGILTSGKTETLLNIKLAADALAMLFISGGVAICFSIRKAKRSGRSFWTPVSRRLFMNFSIPLITGGAFSLILLAHHQVQMIIPAFLIFYGTALVNAWKFTYNEVMILGILEILTGLASAFLQTGGLIFWIFGFGFLHIIYGIFMYRKYEA